MFLIRKTKKSDYGYYLKAFNSSHFRFYGNISKNVEKYVEQIVLIDYLNVLKYIVEKNGHPVGFFHLNKKSKNIVEISIGLFNKFYNIYGVYIGILSVVKAFSLDKNITKVTSSVQVDNISSLIIVEALGAKGQKSGGEIVYFLSKKNFPNKFANKLLHRIENEGLRYEYE